jgi:hypothetical protein
MIELKINLIDEKDNETLLIGRMSDDNARRVIYQFANDEERSLFKEGLPEQAANLMQERINKYAHESLETDEESAKSKGFIRLFNVFLFNVSDNHKARESFAALIVDIFRETQLNKYFGKDQYGYFISLDDPDLIKILNVIMTTAFKQMGLEIDKKNKPKPKYNNMDEIKELESRLRLLKS